LGEAQTLAGYASYKEQRQLRLQSLEASASTLAGSGASGWVNFPDLN